MGMSTGHALFLFNYLENNEPYLLNILDNKCRNFYFYVQLYNIWKYKDVMEVILMLLNKIYLLLILLISSSIFFVCYIYHLINQKKKLTTRLNDITELIRINDRLRAQQHDFKHHLQILLALLKMKKYNKAQNYIDNLAGEVKNLKENHTTEIPVLNALLEAKDELARKYSINLKTSISDSLTSLPLSDITFCRILGNLIDNAIEYLKDQKINQPDINLTISRTEKGYSVTLINPVTDTDHLEKSLDRLMEPGFSSKGKERGMGLTIVRELVNKAKGKIKIDLNKKEAIFIINIKLPESRGQTNYTHIKSIKKEL